MPEKFLDSQIRMPLMTLPVRTVVLTTPSGMILLSPGSKLSVEELRQTGDVTDIVAPSLLHCAGVALASQVFPKARVWGPVGAKKLKPELPWTDFLGEEEWPYQGSIRHIPLKGVPENQESVFFDTSSKTLYVTDLFFNLQHAKGLGARIILGLFGTYRKFGMSKLYLKYVQDRTAFEESLRDILAQDFDRVVMAHGDVLAPAYEPVKRALQSRGFKL